MPDFTQNLLIVGVPGTGKTTVANYLANNCGYTHIDLEEAECVGEDVLLKTIEDFVTTKLGSNDKYVLSWGFPFEYTSLVLYLKDLGVRVVWFGEDESIALKHFNERGTVPERDFWHQVNRIKDFKVREVLDCETYNPYDANNEFKPLEQIVLELDPRVREDDK